jgi:hypothetical protein
VSNSRRLEHALRGYFSICKELVLAPLRPGYTFLILSLRAGPILAPTRTPLEPFWDLCSLTHVILVRLSDVSLTSTGDFNDFGSTQFSSLCFRLLNYILYSRASFFLVLPTY